MASFLAALPLALSLVLMIALRWSAARAGLVGLIAAVVVAVGPFGFSARQHVDFAPMTALAGSAAEALSQLPGFFGSSFLRCRFTSCRPDRGRSTPSAAPLPACPRTNLCSQFLLHGFLRYSWRGLPASARRSRWRRPFWSVWVSRPWWLSHYRSSATSPESRSAPSVLPFLPSSTLPRLRRTSSPVRLQSCTSAWARS